MKAVFVSAALFFAAAYAQTFTVNTPVNSPPVCLPLQVTWTGGTAPYFLSLRDGNSGSPIENLGTINDGTSFRWIVNQPVGTSLGFNLLDNTGTLAQSGSFTVGPGSDTSCIGASTSDSGSTTGAGTGSTTAGATSSGTVSVTTSTSVSVTSPSPSSLSSSATAPGVSTTSAGTAGATSSGTTSRATSSGTAAASAGSASSSASQSTSAGKTFAEMSAAGVFGAIAVALFA